MRRMKSLRKLQLQNLAAVLLLLCLSGLLSAVRAGAGEADVLEVDIRCRPVKHGFPASVCRISVTVQHADSGWKHYANRYDVLQVGGKLITTRVLRHPHVDEQPFRRESGAIVIPHEVEKLKVRAHDLVHGLGGAEVIQEVPHARGKAPEPGSAP